MESEKTRTYTEAVKRGDYDLYTGNLFGKHDNVRTYWEDQLTRSVLRPFLSKLVTHRQNQGKKLEKNALLTELEDWSEYSSHLQFALMHIDRVIADTGWMWYGEPRANIIEPQLGYALRSLEINMQRGIGCGHSLVAILKVTK